MPINRSINPSLPTAMIRRLLLLCMILVITLLTAGCSTTDLRSDESNLDMTSLADMPAEVQTAPVTVLQAYQFNVANPDIMTQIPCYCGCGAMGHTSNYDCYVAGKNEDSSIQYDTHALGCSICVDITQDTMRLLIEGKTVPQIKTYVDQTYSQYGPSNMP